MSSGFETIFLQAFEIAEPDERAAFLDRACDGDADLRMRLDAKLLTADAAGDYFGDGATHVMAELLPAAVPGEKPGDVIGPYKLLQQIGEGGFGMVWMAEQAAPVRRRVALKIIKPGLDSKEVIARFEAERQALAMMDHPNIAKIFDAGATQLGRPYFVMELVRGVRITDYCDQVNLPTAERLALFIQACHAVQHAHQKGIIHRDIKPSNVLVSLHDGMPVPKIIDFGVAKATQSARLTDLTLFTKFDQMVGTPLYMSPEQAEMSGLDMDTRSDIYSLGVLLYELLTGRTPFDPRELMRKGYDEIRRAIREEEPPTPSIFLKTMTVETRAGVAQRRQCDPVTLSNLIRGDLDWIVMKALEKDRTRRYESASGFALDIERHLTNQPVLARPVSQLYRFSRFVKRNKLAFTAGIVVAAAIVVGASVSIWQGLRASAALANLRATAPAFVAEARALADRQEFEKAVEKLDYATKLRPDEPDYYLAKGDFLESGFRFAEAASAYRAALELGSENPRAGSNLKLCEKLAVEKATLPKLTPGSIADLMALMQSEHRSAAEMLPVSRLAGDEQQLTFKYWKERIQGMPVRFDRFEPTPDGLLTVDLDCSGISDLHFLEGMPIGFLELTDGGDRSTVDDLRPLTSMPLRELTLNGTSVTDLSPLGKIPTLKTLSLKSAKIGNLAGLRGLSLTNLHLARTTVRDLSPLRGMPLRELVLELTNVSDLAPLAGMPLESFKEQGTSVHDFSPLARTPLLHLQISQNDFDLSFLRGALLTDLILWDDGPTGRVAGGECKIRGFNVLPSIKSLKYLKLPPNVQQLPEEELHNLETLRDSPVIIQFGKQTFFSGFDVTPTSSKEEFWKDWNRRIGWVQALLKAGIKFKLHWSGFYLFITDHNFRDLGPLKGTEIDSLFLGNTQVTDLSPLEGMTLEKISLFGTPVSDLSPLSGSPVRELVIGGTAVTDLSILRKQEWRTKLNSLDISSTKVTDFSPLADCKELQYLSASNTTLSDLTVLRGQRLVRLEIAGTPVTDLTPLAGMPLTELNLEGTKVTDLTPILTCEALQKIVLPKNARDLLALRRLPRLRSISLTSNHPADADEFWGDEAGRAMESGRFSAAESILTETLNDITKANQRGEVSTAKILDRLANCYCCQGQFLKAAALFREITQTPRDPKGSRERDEKYAWLHLTGALAASGDTDGYQRACAGMVERFRETKDGSVSERVIQACSLAPDSQISESDRAAFLQAAETMEKSKTADRYRANAGLSEYRAGRFPAAESFLVKVQDQETPECASARATSAMIQAKGGKPTQARQTLDKAQTVVDRHWPPQKDDGGGAWFEWLVAGQLTKEAAALLEKLTPR